MTKGLSVAVRELLTDPAGASVRWPGAAPPEPLSASTSAYNQARSKLPVEVAEKISLCCAWPHFPDYSNFENGLVSRRRTAYRRAFGAGNCGSQPGVPSSHWLSVSCSTWVPS